MSTVRTAIYCRISKDKTGEEAGVTRQLEDCRALAEQLGWTVVEEYVDNDISAITGKIRPQYRRLLAAIGGQEVDALVIWHPDRLYRRMVDLIDILAVVQPNETQVATVKAGKIDLTTPAGQMMAEILASVAQYEGKAKADRWMRSIRQRREAGQAPGWGPRLFGYDETCALIPEEVEIARWLASELIDGASPYSLARQLREKGVLTTLGNNWSPQSIKVYMSNPRLAGHATLSRRVPTGQTREDGRPVKRLVVDRMGTGSWQPILSDETFEQVQAALASKRTPTPPRARVSLLIGLVKCAACGTPLASGRLAKRKGETEGRRVYRCPAPPRADGCGKISVDAENVERIAEAYAKDRLTDPRVRAHVVELSSVTGERTGEIIALEERLEELEAQLEEPGTPVAAITRAMDRTRERIETLRTQVVAGPTPLPREGTWPDDLARRARLVRLVVKDVTISPASRRGSNTFEVERVHITPVTECP